MPSVGAVTSNLNITSQTVNYAAKANDFVLADATTAAVTVTLPAGPVVNTIVAVKKVDTTTSAVSVVPTSPAKIDGDTAVVLAAQGSAVSVQFDGTNWAMLSTAEVNTANSVAGIPSGGAATQVLTKNSGTNYDASWVSAAAGSSAAFPAWSSGRVFTAPVVLGGTLESIGFSPSYTYLYPVQVPNACTVSAVTFLWYGVTGTGTFAIYGDSPTAASKGPAAQLYVKAGVPIAASAANWTTVSGINLVLTGPRLLWVAFTTSLSGTAFQAATSTAVITNFVVGGTANGGAYIGLRTTSTSSPLSDFSTTAMTVQGAPQPIIYFQVA